MYRGGAHQTQHGRDAPAPEATAAPMPLLRSSLIAAVWAFLYSLYRAYYAVGGTIGMFGVPVSESQWRFVNGLGAAIILVGARFASAHT